jgi:hypothetical protein
LLTGANLLDAWQNGRSSRPFVVEGVFSFTNVSEQVQRKWTKEIQRGDQQN